MSKGWQRAAALLLLMMLLPAAPAAGEMKVSANGVEISLETRVISITSGTQILIRADLTEPQKAGGEGGANIDVALVLVLGRFLDEPGRTPLSGWANEPDTIDDNDFPPDYDRYTFRFTETGSAGGYAAEGAYTGEIEFTVTARNASGGNISQQQFWVKIGERDSEQTFNLELPSLPPLADILPILGIGLLLLLVSYGVWHFVLKPEEVALPQKQVYDPLKSTLTGVGTGSDLSDDGGEDEEDEDEDEEHADRPGGPVPGGQPGPLDHHVVPR